MENQEEIFKLTPKYNFIYELFMPTGKKVAITFRNFCILLITYIILIVSFNIFNVTIPKELTNGVNVVSIGSFVIIILLIFLFLKILFHIIFQVLQYKNTAFTFYNTYMTYEDNFLNQHKKTIQYINIREVEIRRNIWDRINGFGVIVIYTNADNEFNNGLVIFGIKDTDEWYKKIDNLIHSNTNNAIDTENLRVNNNPKDTYNNKADEIVKEEEDFKNSLK